MTTVGLIVEYNPFHNGHRYHLQQSRKLTGADAVVAVMSGHFLQRGEPAMADKWLRTRMALEGGCDLVIELPVAYATQSAEWFAYGAVKLLKATGVVDAFCFGTESGSLDPLLAAADAAAFEPQNFKDMLKRELDQGVPYPSAYSSAIAAFLSQQGLAEAASFPFSQPNHTLGLHYLIALNRLGGGLKPFTIARQGAQYGDTSVADGPIASATALRKLLFDGGRLDDIAPYLPASTFGILTDAQNKGIPPIGWDRYLPQLLHAIATSGANGLRELRDITEGLEHRIVKSLAAMEGFAMESLLSTLKTKRYTRTRLQRALLSVLLGHAKSDFTRAKLADGVRYIRVLGFSPKGQELLAEMRRSASLPVLLNASRYTEESRYLELDIAATGAYMLGVPGADLPSAMLRDFRDKPVRTARG
ncbi:nucleotidyltransferase [Paenibacillus sp. CAU 1782]